MKYNKSIHKILVVAMVIFTLLSTAVYANSAEPPSFIIIVSSPPEDLSLSLKFSDSADSKPIELGKEKKAWETYFRYFYHMSPDSNRDLDDAVIVVQSSGKSFQCSLPADTPDTYNNLLTLDMQKENLTIGQAPLRIPILVAMRIILTLVIEGAVFFIFGYRKKASWLVFLITNLLTQGALNAMITGPSLGAYWGIGYIFGEILVLAAELIAFTCFVKEFGKGRAVLYTVAANAASLVLGGLLITSLPI